MEKPLSFSLMLPGQFFLFSCGVFSNVYLTIKKFTSLGDTKAKAQ